MPGRGPAGGFPLRIADLFKAAGQTRRGNPAPDPEGQTMRRSPDRPDAPNDRPGPSRPASGPPDWPDSSGPGATPGTGDPGGTPDDLDGLWTDLGGEG